MKSMAELSDLVKRAKNPKDWSVINQSCWESMQCDSRFDDYFRNKPVSITDSTQFVMSIWITLRNTLWQELALNELIKFIYNYRFYPDHIFLEPVDFKLNEGPVVAVSQINPYESTWLTNERFVNFQEIEDRLEDEWETWEEPLLSVGALSHGVAQGHLKEISQEIYDEIFFDLKYRGDVMEEQFQYFTPTIDKAIIQSELQSKGLTYKELADDKKYALVEHIVNSLSHPYLGGAGISRHLLDLLLLHPATPQEAKALIELQN